MENKELIRMFRLTASLMELHDENPFKIRSYTSAVMVMERIESPIHQMSQAQLEKLDGIGKGMAGKIMEAIQTGSHADLKRLLETTPEGVVQMLNIKGIGPKKIKTIWKDLGVDTIEALREACEKNEVSKLKGFGAKTQETILQGLQYTESNKGKLLWAEAEVLALDLLSFLKNRPETASAEVVGDLRRNMETVETLQFLVSLHDDSKWPDLLTELPGVMPQESVSGPFVWRAQVDTSDLKLEVRLVPERRFANQVLLYSAHPSWLTQPLNDNGDTLMAEAYGEPAASEEEIFRRVNLPYIAPELRESLKMLELAKENKLPTLLTGQDLKGTVHNHSTYSDGAHTLEQMAVHCQQLGYQYLGICDHSKSAYYANGLNEFRIKEQHKEIDRLNQQLGPFRIFKGIESDILTDGALDYDNDVLASFDFIVASIHSNLKMDLVKATDRLLTAIANPYTTMLGHPTGRLLLRREGYPIDHKAVIDACAEHGVIIEINANPRRLDLDWRWVEYALSQNVMLSINPDAHSMRGYEDMRYGVLVGRKGGLTAEMTFNAKTRDEVAAYFEDRKRAKGI
ncbi:DNA polymerase/3'-5' exonuclease PolX [Rufibacter latericius]|uniref:DNA polymerase/3'-5' exonuclease PolX n=1 Tax=Rufibacter latericius TaxID=2487040 RepID=A0A3M9ML23_9BACT|nr:DNA polymerase/3'-5' exonuclease PolX [Rufibacter latericius]RNI25917.1 DNA polymerase/3'-5' exonuclease PolX [Rufibacter latericius]